MTVTGSGVIPDVDELLVDSAERLFAGTCSFDVVQEAESSGWAPEVWSAVSDAGFAWIGLPEEAGGSGGTVADACEVLRIAGAHAAPIPLAETAMLGGWLLTEAGLPLPDGAVTVVPGFAGDSLTIVDNGAGAVVSGVARRVPWASTADRVVAIAPDRDGYVIAAIAPERLRIETATNVAGEPRNTVTADDVEISGDELGRIDDPATAERLRLRGALSRTALIAGALEAMSQLTVAYTEQRQQFGRPIGRFQAVQQHLVWGAQDAAITKMAAQMAAHAATNQVGGIDGARFQIAAARSIANESASTATRWAHQAHGAMGMTQEYALHHLSRRLWAWRHEYATTGEWSTVVGRMAEAAGADGLYPLIAS